MNEAELIQYIRESFAHIQIAEAGGNSFFYYCPDGKIPEKTFPFATLVTTDEYDQVSNLSRPGVFRVNVGVSKKTYHSLLGELPKAPDAGGIVETDADFSALDEVMPHPFYGHMGWVSILNPGDTTLPLVKTLLAEAYQATARKKAG